MTISNTVTLILMHFFTFSPFKVNNFAPTTSVPSNVIPDVSQPEVTFHNDVRFGTVNLRMQQYIAEYTVANFYVLQSDIALYS